MENNADGLDETSDNISSLDQHHSTLKTPSKHAALSSTSKKYVTTVKSSKNGEVLQTVVKAVKGNNRRNNVFTCSFTGCPFSSVYSKDLTRHIRKHTGV